MEEDKTNEILEEIDSDGQVPSHAILIAEDNEDDQILLKRAIEKTGIPTQIFFVHHGAQLLDYLKGKKDYSDRNQYPLPDLVIMDLYMPVLTGREVLKTLSEEPELNLPPIVVLSASEDPDDISEIKKLGAKSYITKRTSFEETVRIMKTLTDYWLNVVED